MASVLAAVGFFGFGSAQALDPSAPKAEIVFSNGGRIVSIKADGSGRRELTRPELGYGNADQGDDSPEVSPDGGRLTFVREDELRDDIYRTDLMVANRDGSGAKSIVKAGYGGDTGDETILFAPAWSADGSKIYYVDASYSGMNEDIWISRVIEINADGSGRRVLAEKTVDFNEFESEFGEDGEADRRSLAKYWYFVDVDPSPDGSRLLIGSAGLFGYSGLIGKIRTLDLASGEMTVLAGASFGGSWSSDGTKITFVSQRQKLHEDCYELNCSYTSKIYVMNADGSAQKRVTRGKSRGNEFGPSWSPDGTRISFTSDRNMPSGYGSYEIYSVKPDGSCLTWLTNGYPASTSSRWTPEAGDTDPGECGAAGRKPRVSFTPPARSGAGRPNYWVGRNFRGMLSTYYSGAGSYLDYGDCAFFETKRCRNLPRMVITGENVCRGDLHWSLQFGRFQSMKRQRGALVARSTRGGGRPDGLIVTTGRQSVGIETYSTKSKDTGFAVHYAAFRALRRVGADSPAKRFPSARLSRRAVRKAARLAKRVERGQSLGKRNLPSKRAYLRFHKAIKRIGNVKTVPCPGKKRRPGSNVPGPFPSIEAINAPVDGSQLLEMIKEREGTP